MATVFHCLGGTDGELWGGNRGSACVANLTIPFSRQRIAKCLHVQGDPSFSQIEEIECFPSLSIRLSVISYALR